MLRSRDIPPTPSFRVGVLPPPPTGSQQKVPPPPPFCLTDTSTKMMGPLLKLLASGPLFHGFTVLMSFPCLFWGTSFDCLIPPSASAGHNPSSVESVGPRGGTGLSFVQTLDKVPHQRASQVFWVPHVSFGPFHESV